MAECAARRRLVCRCLGVASHRIYEAARAEALASVAEVTKRLRAGGGCGTCHPEIEEILAEVRGEPYDPALALENRLICSQETQLRVEGSLDSLIRPRLAQRGVAIEGVQVDGLRVCVRLRGEATDDARRLVAERLRKYVCADLEIEVS
jgi:NifU-like protein